MVNLQVSKLVGILLVLGVLALAVHWYIKGEAQEGNLERETIQQVEGIETEIETLGREVREINSIMSRLEDYSFN